MVTKKRVTCLEPEVDSQNCAEFCSAPLWSEWVKVNECKMVRFCETKGWSQKISQICVGGMRRFSKVEKASTKRCPPCPGPSEKEIPCTMATFCGKKVQLSNVRARFMSVKPGKEFKIRKISSTKRRHRIISEFKISLEMVAKSRSRTGSFWKRARFWLGNLLLSNRRQRRFRDWYRDCYQSEKWR